MSKSSSPGASGAGITHSTSYQPTLGFTSDVLNPKDDKAMTIQFNAVLSLEAWRWEDGKSNVYLRFGNPMLGGWKYDIGPGQLKRDAGNGLYVVRFELKLDYEFVKSLYRGISYKYLVYSPRLKEKEKHPWEYLYGHPHFNESARNNRLLKIPNKKATKGALHRQYDTMIFPEGIKPTTLAERIMNVYLRQDDSSRLVIPSPPAMRALCMDIHLEPSRDILLNGSYNNEIHIGTDGIIGLFNSVSMQYIECRGLEQVWTIDISTAFMDWSMNVTGELLTSDKPPLEPHKTLVSGLLLMCSVYKSLDLLHLKNVPDILMITLLKLMVLSTDTAKNDLDCVKSLMNVPNSKQYVIDGLKYLINSVVTGIGNPEHVMDILKALPLYHFMTDDTLEPHQPFRYHCKETKWGDDQLQLYLTKSLIEKQDYQLIDQHHDTLQRLVSFDPKLLYIIPYICPQKDTHRLCDIVPLDIAIAWISESLLLTINSSSELTNYSEKKMEDILIKPMACIQQNIVERDHAVFQVILLCYDATVNLVECLQTQLFKFVNVTKNTMTFVTSTVKLMLCIIDKVKTFKGESDDLIRDRMVMKDLLKGWVAHNEVIGGSFFGGSVRYNGDVPVELRKEKEELLIWKKLLTTDCPTGGIQEDLEHIVTSLVDERVSAIPSAELKIDLFINVESRDEHPDAIRNIFLIKATEALNELVSIQHTSYNLQNWDQHHIIRLFSTILEKKYPNFKDTNEVPFNDLLEWKMWPGFITIYTTRFEIKSKSEDWQLIVACAVSMLEGVCGRIHSGDVTVDELRHIKCHQTQMNKLYNALNSTTQSEPQASLTQTSELHKSIGLRLKEFEYFTEYVNKLNHLITHVGNVLTDYDDLMNQLQVDLQGTKIKYLCHTLPDGSHKVVCFPFAEPLECCLHDFYTMSLHHYSDTFNVFWQDQIKKVSASQCSISVEVVDALLWRPVFDRCNKLLDDLRSKELKLSEVDSLFKHRYGDDLKSLFENLQLLNSGTNACKMHAYDGSHWIIYIVHNIGQYWDLCNYREAAQTFIKIRDIMELTGDFSVVERVAEQTSSQSNQTLSSIDENIVETRKFLYEFASDSNKRICLEAFAECQIIVEWIKGVAKDVRSLLNFVTVALATAAGDEGDMATDKLSNLRTVGSGFSPIIYKLKKTAGYRELQQHCRTLWETLEHIPDLPELMRTCEEDIEWYKSIKEMLGSVEVTSFGTSEKVIDETEQPRMSFKSLKTLATQQETEANKVFQQVQQQVQQLMSAINSLEAENEASTGRHLEQINALTREKEGVVREKRKLKTNLINKNREMEALLLKKERENAYLTRNFDYEKKILKNEKASLEKRNATLEGEKRKLEEEKETLEKDKEIMKEEKTTLLDTLRDIQENNEDLEKGNKLFQDMQQELQGKNQRLQEENQKLQDRQQELHNEQQRLQEENQTIQDERQMENQIFQEEQQKLHDKNQQLQDELQVLQEENQTIQDERQMENQIFQEEQQKLHDEVQQLRDEQRVLQKQIFTNEQSWKINHKDAKMTKQELGRGGWGVIWVGEFRGQKVAVKQMHESIVSEYNLQLLHREINTMSQLRHPNLVQFIGAVVDDPSGQPLIITEIMDISLRKAYEKKQLTPVPVHICLAIMRDVAVGLNYLHCLPDPIIHRDVSSANVLLESKGHGRWKTKISDFGSAKFACAAITKAAGAAAYCAPEAQSINIILDENDDQLLTSKMDVFSYGVLLCEVLTCQFPNDHGVFKAMLEQVSSQHDPYLHDLIQSCIKRNPQDRPNMDQVIQQFDTHT